MIAAASNFCISANSQPHLNKILFACLPRAGQLTIEHSVALVPLRERSFQLTQDPVGFTDGKFDDFIRTRLRIAVGVDT
jgi:hypothetical protein